MRVDCTGYKGRFRDLIFDLAQMGFVVDHFHLVDHQTIEPEEYSSNDKTHKVILGFADASERYGIHFVRQEVLHINLNRDADGYICGSEVVAENEVGVDSKEWYDSVMTGEHDPLGTSVDVFVSVYADEWHDR